MYRQSDGRLTVETEQELQILLGLPGYSAGIASAGFVIFLAICRHRYSYYRLCVKVASLP